MNKINVTDARKDMSTFFDNVIHEKPIILKKRKYEAVLIEKSLLSVFLSSQKIVVKTVVSESKKVMVIAPMFDVIGEGETRVSAIENLCDNLFAYANEVYNNFMFYYYGQNIKDKLGHIFLEFIHKLLPLFCIFHILLCENNEQLLEILEFQSKSKKKQ